MTFERRGRHEKNDARQSGHLHGPHPLGADHSVPLCLGHSQLVPGAGPDPQELLFYPPAGQRLHHGQLRQGHGAVRLRQRLPQQSAGLGGRHHHGGAHRRRGHHHPGAAKGGGLGRLPLPGGGGGSGRCHRGGGHPPAPAGHPFHRHQDARGGRSHHAGGAEGGVPPDADRRPHRLPGF